MVALCLNKCGFVSLLSIEIYHNCAGTHTKYVKTNKNNKIVIGFLPPPNMVALWLYKSRVLPLLPMEIYHYSIVTHPKHVKANKIIKSLLTSDSQYIESHHVRGGGGQEPNKDFYFWLFYMHNTSL